MPVPASLILDNFGLAYRERIVLADLTLTLPAQGVTVLMGPPGSGKSSVLRYLCGQLTANPGLRTWGDARLNGCTLPTDPAPALVGQSARQMLASVFDNLVLNLPERSSMTRIAQRAHVEQALRTAGLDELLDAFGHPAAGLDRYRQRVLATAREAFGEPPLLCVDEPTTGLTDEEAARLLAYLRYVGRQRPVLLVLHRRDQVREVADHVVVIGGGRVLDQGSAGRVLDAPAHAEAARFLATGHCRLPAPDARPEDLDDDTPPPPPIPRALPALAQIDAAGPRGFLWLERGRLAGMPRPGVVNDIDYDLAAVRRAGVTMLISLTEAPLDRATVERHGLAYAHFPIPDMGAPAIDACRDWCLRIEAHLARGSCIAVHCQAGLGRTGTILAACLIHRGSGCLEALETVGRIERRWPQSAEQFAFLEAFASAMGRSRPLSPDSELPAESVPECPASVR